MSDRYQICVRCIMDTSDPEIDFDAEGVCSHCRRFEEVGRPVLERVGTPEGKRSLADLVERMKERGQGRDYDCVIGVSGGVDSTYVAYAVKTRGLRPLAVHCDTGWNSELAVKNIENIVTRLDIDLRTFVVDWEEMRDLQLAFFKASLANCDIPQDHAFLAALYRTAASERIPFIVTGSNLATESILPRAWGYNAGDLRHLRAVHRRFGTVPLRRYPTLGFVRRYFYYPVMRGIRTIPILDYLPYRKSDAKRIIREELGWRDYGGKHYESIFTRFFQAYYLPRKFGFDKRRAHLSSLVVSGELTRDEALREMGTPPHPQKELLEDKEYVAKKLGISVGEFERLLALPTRTYRDFPSSVALFGLKDRAVAWYRRRSRLRESGPARAG